MARATSFPARWFTPLLALVASVALVTGCSTIGADDPTSNPTGISTDAEATPTEPAQDAEFATVDQALLDAGRGTLTHEGLTVTNLLVTHEMPGLAYSLDIVRGQVVRQHHWDGGGQLTVTPTLVASSTKALAVALKATTPAGTNTAIVHYDPQTNHSFASPALIAPAQWEGFVAAVRELAGESGDQAATQLAEPTFPNGAGPAIGFSASGDLVVHFQVVDGSTIAPVVVPGDQAAGMLSQFGTHARAAARYPTAAATPERFLPFDPTVVGKPSTTTPSPSATPTATTTSGSSSSPSSTASSTPAPVVDKRPQLVLGTDCQVAKCVALTFDDGPVPQTQDVLDQLNALKAPATFFVLGTSVDNFPKMLTATAANGMEIASHNQVHNQMSRTGGELLTRQVTMSADNIRELTGADPLFLRPPYGARNKSSDGITGKQGMAVALWSVDTEDWKHSKASPQGAQNAILAAVNKQVDDGGVILMHDIHGNSRAATTAVVNQLREKGYTLVTMAELAPADWRFGRAYCSSPAQRPSCVG
ncbi:polysaccharide deacetylase family protein [Propionibacteriaceae bacterium Y1923]|uniref:polysaccharide deacetylase family protein n=1 Tax=Aestuariimicrobium sp. Y1814 TaxID=3418742 RepID=UPI003C15C661